ncbi:unnamed protein product [Cuscuta epithymum]|nr:unnamed protein product [Cuscuta epithymum]
MSMKGEVGESSLPWRGEQPPPLSSPTRFRARGDSFLVTCKVFSFVTSLAAILCIAVNSYSAFRSFKNGYDVFDGIFRCYAVVIAIIVVLAETEWGFFIKFWKVLGYWAGRGMLQIFVAVMTRAYPEYYGKQHELMLLQQIASYLLLACGAIYLLSGILCIGFLKRARENKESSKEQTIMDLEVQIIGLSTLLCSSWVLARFEQLQESSRNLAENSTILWKLMGSKVKENVLIFLLSFLFLRSEVNNDYY